MNGMFGCHPEPRTLPKDGLDIGSFTKPPDPNRKFKLALAEIRVPNMDAWRLYWDYLLIHDVALTLPENSWEAQQAWQTAVDMINAFKRGNRESLLQGRKIAQRVLGQGVDTSEIWDTNKDDTIIWAIGHCHIDTAWLWPFAETKRKVARSWSTQCDLMDRYPEYHFSASTAQQYLWLKEDYPGLFERVKKVHERRFTPVGGSWVEFDSHYASGESLIRQFLLGQRFFESNFGERCKTGWLPDTFGYSSQLPQLLRSACMKYFFTQKVSWNSANAFPHTTFKWVGLDGSQVLAHMVPSESYGSQVTVAELQMEIENHKSLREDRTSMLVFGNGDGGGGPLPQMIEKLRRAKGLADNLGGRFPHVKPSTPDNFFERLEGKVKTGTNLATHHGEIYLESCRGCYTTQAKTKLANRKAEFLLNELEFLATIASVHDNSWTYPKRALDSLWQTVLLCHFHDVLPGSAIEMVFEDASKLYAELFEKGTRLYDKIAGKLEMAGEGGVSVLNTLQWPRSEVIHLSANKALGLDMVMTQNSISGGVVVAINAKATAASAVAQAAIKVSGVKLTETEPGTYIMANEKVKVSIVVGEITSFIDLDLGRELIPEGEKGNRLVLFYDQAMTFWDAWDVEIYHLESLEYLGPESVKVVETGPLRASLKVFHKISEGSWIKSTISLDAYCPPSATQPPTTPQQPQHPIQSLLKVSCEVEWHESRRFLKVEFPWAIHSDHATYETQFGIVRQPTHYNTSWDYAKFEVVCHRFADLSEYGYGVAVLNDCKYGFETQGNVQRLSLLRSPKGPDLNADMERQRFGYAVAPHRGGFGEAGVWVARAGVEFNRGMRVVRVEEEEEEGGRLGNMLDCITIEGPPNVFLETVKRGEDDEGLDGHYKVRPRVGMSVIVCVYEGLGGVARSTIKVTLPVRKVFMTNILEDDLEEVPLEDGVIPLLHKPFEVITLRLQL